MTEPIEARRNSYDGYQFDTQESPHADHVDAEAAKNVVTVPEPSRERLNERQLVDYRHHREELITWLLTVGKDPDHAERYAPDVVRRRAHDCDMFYRYVWDEHADGYTTAVTTDHADAHMRKLAVSDYSETHKENRQKALKSLFRWRCEEWDPEITFNGPNRTAPRDYLTREERTRLREAALRWDSIPHYAALSPEERSRWKQYLAKRLGKPTSEVRPEDFDNADGFKYASLVTTSLDAGLRPVEVGRAAVGWVDVDNAALRIPKEQSAKNRDNWVVSLQRGTAELLHHWLIERQNYDKYTDTDTLWLTRHGNPYRSNALSYVVEKLAEVGGIDTENRSLSWYSLRHSVGTYMTREEGLAAAQTQLRHRSIRTTAKYDAAPLEDRRDALGRMG